MLQLKVAVDGKTDVRARLLDRGPAVLVQHRRDDRRRGQSLPHDQDSSVLAVLGSWRHGEGRELDLEAAARGRRRRERGGVSERGEPRKLGVVAGDDGGVQLRLIEGVE